MAKDLHYEIDPVDLYFFRHQECNRALLRCRIDTGCDHNHRDARANP